jgi:hypothetical protein
MLSTQLQRPGLPPPTALVVALAQDHDLHLVEWADASKVALEGPVTKSADLEHIIVNSYPLQLVTGGRNGRLWRTGVIQGPRATVGFLPKAVIK